MSRQKEYELSNEERQFIFRLKSGMMISFVILAALYVLALCSCSHKGEQIDLQQSAASAKVNADLKAAAIMAKVGDYNAEIRYDAGLMPVSPYQKALLEIVNLQGQLTGPGKQNEQTRKAFVNSLIKDDLAAHRSLYTEGQDIAKLQADKQAADIKADKATAKSNAYAVAAASAWDSFSWLQDYVIAAVVVLVVIYGIHLFIIYGKTAATVAAKIP